MQINNSGSCVDRAIVGELEKPEDFLQLPSRLHKIWMNSCFLGVKKALRLLKRFSTWNISSFQFISLFTKCWQKVLANQCLISLKLIGNKFNWCQRTVASAKHFLVFWISVILQNIARFKNLRGKPKVSLTPDFQKTIGPY